MGEKTGNNRRNRSVWVRTWIVEKQNKEAFWIRQRKRTVVGGLVYHKAQLQTNNKLNKKFISSVDRKLKEFTEI